jgi:hypothetical protein
MPEPNGRPRVGDRAPDQVVLTSEGEERRLSFYWRDRPGLLVFLRHWG